MNHRMFVPLSVLTLSLLIGAGALATYARQEPGISRASPVIGTVDMHQVFDSSDAPQLIEQRNREEAQTLIQLSTRIAGTSYLEPQELSEYLKLLTASNRDAKQEARLNELTGLSDTRGQELDALRIKNENSLTADDHKRMQRLQDQSQTFQQNILPRIQQSLRLDAEARVETLRREQMNRLRGIVGKVAAARGITDVWDSDNLVYSVNDLTAGVIRSLKKK